MKISFFHFYLNLNLNIQLNIQFLLIWFQNGSILELQLNIIKRESKIYIKLGCVSLSMGNTRLEYLSELLVSLAIRSGKILKNGPEDISASCPKFDAHLLEPLMALGCITTHCNTTLVKNSDVIILVNWNVTTLICRGSNFSFFAAIDCSLLEFNALIASCSGLMYSVIFKALAVLELTTKT